MRFELTQAYAHYPLKVACLPIPPPGQVSFFHHANDRLSAQNRTRTCTTFQSLEPETSASTNSATWALMLVTHIVRAKDGARTRDPNLGKVMLYQLSYFRVCGCKDKTTFWFVQIILIKFLLLFSHYFLTTYK